MRWKAGKRLPQRWTLGLLACVTAGGLAGCSREPDFDARFEKAEADIAARAKALDEAAQMAETAEGIGAVDTGAVLTGADGAQLRLGLPVATSAAKTAASSGE